VVAAVKKGTAFDTMANVVAVLGQSLPQFWVGMVLIITIGESHTNYASTKKVSAWNLGHNLYDNNLRYVIRQ
jgi:ABC-type dipeptide/oligopeptide/nickel transport system permease component